MKKTPRSRLLRPTALVVDDNPMDRELAASTLRDRGLEPLIAKDGFEAIRLLSGGARDLAFLIVDTEMPGVHGWEVIRFARGKAPAVPILRLGRPDDEVPGHEYRALRVVPVLSKPFTVGQLLASLGPRFRPRDRRASALDTCHPERSEGS